MNFFPLASGSFCVSRTITRAGEYSGRGGLQYYTQCLVVPPDSFRRFANNPFAVLRAAVAQGTFVPQVEVPAQLEPLRLVGRCAIVDHGLLTDLSHDPGTEWLTSALAEMLAAPRWALATSAPQAPRLIAGLFNCLPVEMRGEFSFTTGLRLSPRRPFRIVCVPPEPAAIRRAERQHGPVFAIGGQPVGSAADRGWAGYVAEVLRSGRTSTLATCLARNCTIDGSAELNAWGDRLHEELGDTADVRPDSDRSAVDQPDVGLLSGSRELGGCGGEHASDEPQFPRLAEATNFTAVASELDTCAAAVEPSSQGSQAELSGRPLEKLELMDLVDDAVFDAVAGQAGAIDRLRTLWPLATRQLAHDVLEESKVHYLRYALLTWRQCQQGESLVDPTRGALVLDVLAVVLE